MIDLAKTAKNIKNITTIVKSTLYKDFLKFSKELVKTSITKNCCSIDYLDKTFDVTNTSHAKVYLILKAHSEYNGRIEEKI